MQQQIFDQALASIGWNIQGDNPIANDENMKLLNSMADLLQEKKNIGSSLQSHEERAENILTHISNAELNISHNLKLLQAYQSEVRTETHLYKLAKCESSKLNKDLKQLKQDLVCAKKYEYSTEKELQRRTKTIDDITNRINWAKASLVEWRLAMEDGNQANLLIEKYCKEDADKAIKMDNKRRMLQNNISKNRKILIDTYEDQKSLEQNLNRTANLYRTAHAERRELVETWKNAINQMNHRESDIHTQEHELERIVALCQETGSVLKYNVNELNEMIANNRTLEESIELLNAEISAIKERIQVIAETIALRKNDVGILRKELQGLHVRIQQERQSNRQGVHRNSDKEIELSELESLCVKLEDKCTFLENKNTTAQERLQVLEDMMDSEQKAQYNLSQEINRVNGIIYRSQQQLVNIRNDEKLVNVENERFKVTTSAMQRSLQNMQKQIGRQTDVHYELAFKAVEIEKRIAKIQGTVVDPTVEKNHQEYLSQLEKRFIESSKTLQSLQTQTSKLDENMRKITICFNNDMKDIKKMNYRIKEAQGCCEGGLKKLKLNNQANQEKIVEISLLKMRVNDLDNQITQCDNKAYNLEKHRIKLKRTIKERMVEINNQFELLTIKRKHMLEERYTLKADMGERSIRVDAAKARYELTTLLLGTNDDGTLVTSTQIKIEAAQEKLILLDDGNTLNENVLKAENEIKAMEKTLSMLNNSNNSYRKTFLQIDDKGDCATAIRELQSSYCKTLAHLKSLRYKIIQQERNNDESCKKMETVKTDLEIQMSTRIDNNEILAKIHKDLLDQREKIQRAEREVRAALQVIRQQPISSEFLSVFEKDLDLHDLQFQNSKALKQLADLSVTDVCMASEIMKALCAKGLKFPELPKSEYSLSWRSDISTSFSKDINSSRSSLSNNLFSKVNSSQASIISINFPHGNTIPKK